MKDRIEPFACLSCAGQDLEPQGGNIQCAECGFRISRRRYSYLIEMAGEAFLYGFAYRRYYERQKLEHRKIATKALLVEPSECLKFLSLAVLAGIIGNASYAAVRAMVAKLWKKISAPTRLHIQSDPQVDDSAQARDGAFVKAVLDDACQLEEFLQFLEDFQGGLLHVDLEVKGAIEEEIKVHAACNSIMDQLRKTNCLETPSDSRGMSRAIEKGLLNVNFIVDKNRRLKASDTAGLFSHLTPPLNRNASKSRMSRSSKLKKRRR